MATINKITLPNGDSYDIEDASAVKGVKGNSESSYRTGQVNLTAANIGAIPSNSNGNTQNLLRPLQLNGLADVTLDSKINTLRANRLAFLPADQIIIEKTTDGGTTWVDAGIADSTKVGLFSETRAGVSIPLLNGVKSIQCGLRITITGMKYNVPSGTAETSKYNYWNSNYVNTTERYNQLKEMYFWVGANSDTISVKVERATGSNSTNWSTIFSNNNFGMTGWSGNDYIRFSQGVFGGGTTQTGNYWNYRLTFFTRGPGGGTSLSGTNTSSAQSINEIRGYGDTWWTAGNEYAANDKIYTHDYLKNVTFPAKVTATSFSGSLTGNVTGNVSGSAGTAGAFTSAKSITLTGDVTGSASSTGGWSIATTVANDSHNHTAATLSGVALSTDVLTKTNTTSYTPSANYHPATKKYVDDSISSNLMIVTISRSGSTYSSDKTFNEIRSHIANGGTVVCKTYFYYDYNDNNVYHLVHNDSGYLVFAYFTQYLDSNTSQLWYSASQITITSSNVITFNGVVTGSYVTPSSTTPKALGTASVGTEYAFARGDHVHPTDTTRAAVNDVLTKTNTTSYTPSANYHPATKKYVDDAILNVGGTPDWDENDSTSPDYIENRTHYRTSIGNVERATIEAGYWSTTSNRMYGTTYNRYASWMNTVSGMSQFFNDYGMLQRAVVEGASTVPASIIINGTTTNHTLTVDYVEDEYNSTYYLYDSTIVIGFQYSSFGDENGNNLPCMYISMVYAVNTLGISDNDTIVTINIEYPIVEEQFEYYKLNSGYLNGKLIRYGKGVNGEVFNSIYNVASGDCSHAEGTGTTASGYASHAEGNNTVASGNYSHAEGSYTVASGSYSHADGWQTTAQRRSQHVFGEYNILDTGGSSVSTRGTYIEIVGKGTYTARSNARTLDWSGNEVLAGKLTVGTGPTNNMDVATKQYVDNAVGSGGGSGGSSTLTGLTDTSISSPADGQILMYNSSTGKWVNTTLPIYNGGVS